MQPVINKNKRVGCKNIYDGTCPKCKTNVSSYMNYCYKCGLALDWGEKAANKIPALVIARRRRNDGC